ncbi:MULTISPECIES: TspO/MBR family protein [unclassified Achromobacter]|uniref:TspO/MBR family protein n=1 Tax=unclassified Achromobacter TaxID=2626865 RepID=UPI000B518A69|nr:MULTISPECIES: TspO/MBR family protein [unclassified Achromobacter]OWT73653.1 sensory protein [Achromobacter sp. HZ34]OWT79431.1 sensory protein [Achromobacter sp. HZ28]
MTISNTRQLLGLLGWLAAGLVTGAIGAIASVQAAEFYGTLVQPAWAPPASVFGPAWTVLYVLMSVAAWLVWRAGGWHSRGPVLRLFLVQLAVNALWSWLFFAWHLGAWAFADICVLWLLILATLIGFWRVRALAGLLLVPYLAWVSFATALCYRVWRDNPGVLG